MRTVSKELALQVQNKYDVKTVFSQNAKMRKSSNDGIHIYNWGIPAFKSSDGSLTCPNATKCIAGCYAKMGAYIWSNVAQAYENRYSLSRDKNFKEVIMFHVQKLLDKHRTGKLVIRIHDSGDFYSAEYFQAWKDIAAEFIGEKRVMFYAYTKMVTLAKTEVNILKNFTVILSYGGKEDHLIDPKKDRHSRVFESKEELLAAGYVDASSDDMLALTKNKKVGLIYHGNKNYHKTSWDKVA